MQCNVMMLCNFNFFDEMSCKTRMETSIVTCDFTKNVTFLYAPHVSTCGSFSFAENSRCH